MQEHKEHIHSVLAKLQEFNIQTDVNKCEFYITEIKYLSLIISKDGIKIDSAKVEAIKNWSTPKHVKDVQVFVGFCNFYQYFIQNFSKIAGPFNSLTKKDAIFVWSTDCSQAFQELKLHACKAPILKYFNPSKQCFIETDSSNYINTGMLLQKGEDSLLHPVTYFLQRMAPVKCNYKIYDKELFAIICCFKEWQPELEGTRMPVQVLTDHKSFEYFMTMKKLMPRQARWVKFLSEFNFIISYQSGKKNNKANALTQKLGDYSADKEDKQLEHYKQVLLPPEYFGKSVELQPIEENKEYLPNIKTPNLVGQETLNLIGQSDLVGQTESNKKNSTLPEWVMQANQKENLYTSICAYLKDSEVHAKPKSIKLKDCRVNKSLLM